MPFTQKRKLSQDDSNDFVDYQPSVKHVKFTTAALTTDEVAMTDVQNLINCVPFPTFSHRSPSQLSIDTTPSGSPNYVLSTLQYPNTPSSCYPTFELYPEVETPMDIDESRSSLHHHQHANSIDSTDSHLGLLQPSTGTGSAFQHGGNCTQIPRLRLSSHVGLSGSRSLWSHCESCGAIEMVKA